MKMSLKITLTSNIFKVSKEETICSFWKKVWIKISGDFLDWYHIKNLHFLKTDLSSSCTGISGNAKLIVIHAQPGFRILYFSDIDSSIWEFGPGSNIAKSFRTI